MDNGIQEHVYSAIHRPGSGDRPFHGFRHEAEQRHSARIAAEQVSGIEQIGDANLVRRQPVTDSRRDFVTTQPDQVARRPPGTAYRVNDQYLP